MPCFPYSHCHPLCLANSSVDFKAQFFAFSVSTPSAEWIMTHSFLLCYPKHFFFKHTSVLASYKLLYRKGTVLNFCFGQHWAGAELISKSLNILGESRCIKEGQVSRKTAGYNIRAENVSAFCFPKPQACFWGKLRDQGSEGSSSNISSIRKPRRFGQKFHSGVPSRREI